MLRGDVYWVNFDPSLGGEIQKKRPAILVSNDAANRAANRVQVVPLSSNVRRVGSWEARILLDGRPQKAMADQIRTIAKERLISKTGAVSAAEMALVENAIRVQLGMR